MCSLNRGDGTSLNRDTTTFSNERVANEDQHILALPTTEVLGDSKTNEGDTNMGMKVLTHMAEDKSDLRATPDVDDMDLNRFLVEIVTVN